MLQIDVGREKGLGNQTLYLTYRTGTEAKAAFSKLNNFKFDKNHTLQCFSINEVRSFLEEEEKNMQNLPFAPPKFATSAERLAHNLDEQCRDQFVVREANMLYLNWLDHLDKSAKNALSSDFLALDYVASKAVFSPRGSYLAVCSAEGTHLYHGATLGYKGFLPQTGAVDAKFSSDERVIVTSNGSLSKNRENFIIWGVEEQLKVKAYKAHANQSLDSFQFSADSQKLAVIQQHEIAVYGLSSVEELKKQVRLPEEEQSLLKVAHVQKIEWLRQSPWMIVMCFELDYNPVNMSATRIFLYNHETRQERRWRAWSEHAKNGEIFVSERGDWVAISLKKFLKRNHFATVIQIANLLRREEPLEIVSVEVKE